MYRATRTICTAGKGTDNAVTLVGPRHNLSGGLSCITHRSTVSSDRSPKPGKIYIYYTWCSVCLARSGLSWKASVGWEFRWIFCWQPFRGNCRNSFERRMLERFNRFYFIFLEEGMLCILRMTGVQMFLFFSSKIKLIRTSDNKSRIILACFEYYCHNNFFKQLCNEKIIQRCIILGWIVRINLVINRQEKNKATP